MDHRGLDSDLKGVGDRIVQRTSLVDVMSPLPTSGHRGPPLPREGGLRISLIAARIR
jgi:hypothetical protein